MTMRDRVSMYSKTKLPAEIRAFVKQVVIVRYTDRERKGSLD